QRAAIATALANQPKVLLADEPTGELDSLTAQDVFSALQTTNTELGVTVLVVTHDPAVSSQVRRTIAIRDGKTSSETIRHAANDEAGQTTLHAREYATLDRAGRVQLPREMTRRLAMRNRVELQEERDHIGVWPDHDTDQDPGYRVMPARTRLWSDSPPASSTAAALIPAPRAATWSMYRRFDSSGRGRVGRAPGERSSMTKSPPSPDATVARSVLKSPRRTVGCPRSPTVSPARCAS